MEAYVKHEIQNNIATIEFFHPEQNSLPGHILAQLAQTITEVGNNPEAKVIILQSGGDDNKPSTRTEGYATFHGGPPDCGERIREVYRG